MMTETLPEETPPAASSLNHSLYSLVPPLCLFMSATPCFRVELRVALHYTFATPYTFT